MTVRICDRCGDITLDDELCICATPYDPAERRRRHRAAVDAAARTTAAGQAETGAVPAHRRKRSTDRRPTPRR